MKINFILGQAAPKPLAKTFFFVGVILMLCLLTTSAKAALTPTAEKIKNKNLKLGIRSELRSANKIKQNILVAVIDTGADVQHKDLKQSIWTNPGETGIDAQGNSKATNGIDDDGNGYVDDVHGWNFVDDTNKVFDTEGHGTHVTGIIKKEFEKQTQTTKAKPTNVSVNLQLMILKYYSATARNEVNVQNTAKAFRYATKMHAQIINYSAGGGSARLFRVSSVAGGT